MQTEEKRASLQSAPPPSGIKIPADLAVCLSLLAFVVAFFARTVFLALPISKVNMLAEWDTMFASQAKGATANGLDLSGILLNVPYYFLLSECFRNGQLPLWNPYTGFGFPLAGDIEATILSPLRLIFTACPTLEFYNLMLVGEVAIAVLGMYCLGRSLQMSRFASAFGAATYGFCPYILFFLEISLGSAYTLFPLVTLMFVRAAASPTVLRAMLAGAAAAFVILTGHPESAFFGIISATMLLVALRMVAHPGMRGQWLTLRTVSIAAIVAFCLCAPVLIPFIEFMLNSDCYKFAHHIAYAMPWPSVVINSFQPIAGAGSPFLGVFSLVLVSGAIAWGRKIVYATAAVTLLLILVVCQVGPGGWLINNSPLHVVNTIYGTPAVVLLLSLLCAFGLQAAASAVELPAHRRLPVYLAMLGAALLSLIIPLVLRLLKIDLAPYGFDAGLPLSSLSYSAWNMSAIFLAVALLLFVFQYFRPGAGTPLLLIGLVGMSFASQAVIAKKSLPLQNKFEYRMDAPGPFLQTHKSRIVTVGEHLLRPNSHEIFEVNNVLSHKSLFPARYQSFLRAAGADIRQLNQVIGREFNHLIDLAGVRYILSTSPIHSTKEPSPHLLELLSSPLKFGNDVELMSARSAYFPQSSEVAVELDWVIRKTSSRRSYILLLRDAQDQKIRFTEPRHFPVDSAVKVSEKHSLPVPLSLPAGTPLRLCVEVFDWDQVQHLPDTTHDTSPQLDEFSTTRSSPRAEQHFKLLSESPNGVRLYENTAAAPEAFIATNLIRAESAEHALKLISEGDFDWEQSVVVEQPVHIPAGQRRTGDRETSVSVRRPGPNQVVVDYTSEKPGMLVLTDVFYPGWIAELDGNSRPILRTDYLFRGVAVPAGTHRVTFTYMPVSFYGGAALAALALCALLLVLIHSRRARK